MIGVDRNDDLCIIGQGHEHADLGIRLEARKHARGVVIVEKLAAELEIQLATKLRNTLPDASGLHFDIHVVVESDVHAIQPSTRNFSSSYTTAETRKAERCVESVGASPQESTRKVTKIFWQKFGSNRVPNEGRFMALKNEAPESRLWHFWRLIGIETQRAARGAEKPVFCTRERIQNLEAEREKVKQKSLARTS